MSASVVDQLLSDDLLWRDSEGRVWHVSEMDAAHVRNLRRWLARRADSFKFALECSCAFGPYPQGEAARDAFDDGFDMLLRESPRPWLRSCPLYRALLVREWAQR